jgi:hypothetical protein
LETLKHPNIIKTHRIEFAYQRLFLVLEYLDTNLTDYNKAFNKRRGERLPEIAIMEIMK